MVDSWDELGETYPPHSISHIVPKHKTQTELTLDRLGDLKNSAYKLKVKQDERYPYYVPEQPAHQDNWVENPVISSIAQRAHADNEAARVRAGLYPNPTYVNPEKEQKQPGLEWVENPVFQTRSQVLETRKELMKRDLDEQRCRGEETYVPLTVRRAQQEEQEYQFRKGHMSNMTKTRLEDYRKKERIEYDMAHFGIRHRELPRYSDQAHPWWTLAQQNKHRSAPSLLKDAKPEEPAYKITQTRPDMKIEPKPERAPQAEMVVAESPELEQQQPGIKTVKRWTTDLIEHNQLRNQPRMFDSLRPAKTYAKDFAPLENFSSFEWTRNQALRQQAEAQRGDCAEEQALPDAVHAGGRGWRSEHRELRPDVVAQRGRTEQDFSAAVGHDVLRRHAAYSYRSNHACTDSLAVSLGVGGIAPHPRRVCALPRRLRAGLFRTHWGVQPDRGDPEPAARLSRPAVLPAAHTSLLARRWQTELNSQLLVAAQQAAQLLAAQLAGHPAESDSNFST